MNCISGSVKALFNKYIGTGVEKFPAIIWFGLRYLPSSQRLVIGCCIVVSALTLNAKFVEISVEEMVQRADAGVVATLTNVNKTPGWGKVHAMGILKAEKVFFGPVAPGEEVPIKWTIYPGVLSDGDISRVTGKSIWLISLGPDNVASVWPQGILDVSQKREVFAAMQNPVRVKAKLPFNSEKPYAAQLIYRNATTATMKVPLAEMRSGRLTLPAGTIFTGDRYGQSSGWTHKRLVPISGSITFTSTPKMVSLTPGQSKIMELDMALIYPVEPDFLDFSWRVPGIGKSTSISLGYSHNTDENYDPSGDSPLWVNFWILLRYSPTREIILGLIVGAATLGIYFLTRKNRLE